MADSITTITDGQVVDTSTMSSSAGAGTDSLGKEEFLRLLVTQMQYQDPLNPKTDTDFIAQLAQFSSLEQMQNLNSSTQNAKAFSLLGKEVVMSVKSATGTTSTIQGVVDYVTIQNGKTYASIDDELYSIDNLVKVLDTDYSVSLKAPSVTSLDATFDHSIPKDVNVEVNLGSEGYEATSVAVVINGSAVESKNLSYKDGKLTIDKDAFSGLDAQKYAVAFVFNDSNSTVVADKVKLTVKGIKTTTTDTATEEIAKDSEVV